MLLVWLGQLKWLGGQYTGNLENYLTTAEIINKVNIKGIPQQQESFIQLQLYVKICLCDISVNIS